MGLSMVQLYDLSKDIGETLNVANENPEIIKKVRQLFEEAHSPSPNFMWKPEYKSTNTL